MARDMPIGLCTVCHDPLDLSDAGICKTCGQGFHWGGCGGWYGGEHACHNCAPELVEEVGCPHCGDPDCDTDCVERAEIFREHRRNQLLDVEQDDEEDSPQEASDV